MTFILSIETDAGSYQYGYHLGTIEATAREISVAVFHHRVPEIGDRIVSVALTRNREMFDCYDGKWSSEEEAA